MKRSLSTHRSILPLMVLVDTEGVTPVLGAEDEAGV
jgi:acetyl-CoA carboxylase alpha subunit